MQKLTKGEIMKKFILFSILSVLFYSAPGYAVKGSEDLDLEVEVEEATADLSSLMLRSAATDKAAASLRARSAEVQQDTTELLGRVKKSMQKQKSLAYSLAFMLTPAEKTRLQHQANAEQDPCTRAFLLGTMEHCNDGSALSQERAEILRASFERATASRKKALEEVAPPQAAPAAAKSSKAPAAGNKDPDDY